MILETARGPRPGPPPGLPAPARCPIDDVDQFQRDILHLLRFSLEHPADAAPVIFPMFDAGQIQRLYAIPRDARARIWTNRDRPEYRALLSEAACS